MSGVLSQCFESQTENGSVAARLYLPDDEPLQLVQIIHGMGEHMARYDDFCRFLTCQGRAVIIHDHAGHGQSAEHSDLLGYFGKNDGWQRVIDDLENVRSWAKQQLKIKYPALAGEKGLPVILLGHSMGSFISRLACTRPDSDLSAAVFSGTSAGSPLVRIAYLLAKRSVKKNGPLYRDAFLARLTGAGFLKKIDSPRTEVDWLSRDADIVAAYDADPLCGFTFTAAGYADLYRWLLAVSSPRWAVSVPQALPILLFAGDADPVGQYGRGPRKVARRLKKSGKQVTLILYPGGRHEMLNETNRRQVWDDVLNWLKQFDPDSPDSNLPRSRGLA